MIYMHVSEAAPGYRVQLTWKEIGEDEIETIGEYTIGTMEFIGMVSEFTRDYVMGTARFMPIAFPFGFTAIYMKGDRDHVRRILRNAGVDGADIPFG